MMQSGESGRQLADLIKKAISDCELTQAEHDEILAHASADQVIDAQEQSLLSQLQELIANGTVKKVR
jgi:hydroxylamine reductase (hybrid-cluster protein)